MNPKSAPLYETMVAHYFQRNTSFHVPGHKGGKGVDPFAEDFYEKIMGLDLTEIAGLDDLHNPSGPIKEAQDLAAACFGAEETFFLINGSTVGNLAMILSVCARNELLLVQRNVHKSVIHGLMLAGAHVVFLPDQCEPLSGLASGVSINDINIAMDRYPNAKGVFLTNPNYYGMGIDLSNIAVEVHSRGMILMVDEAHGAHYGLHPRLSSSALSCGADAVVQSTHKMLTSLTMGAMLHLKGNRIDRSLIKQSLAMLQSSSPSYPIMASLDLTRRWMHVNGKYSLEKGLQVIDDFRIKFDQLPFLATLQQPCSESNFTSLDPFKFAIHDLTGTLDGFQLKQKLEEAGCFPEMADANRVLLHFSLATDVLDMNRLLEALQGICNHISLNQHSPQQFEEYYRSFPYFSKISLPISMGLLQNASEKVTEDVYLKEAINRQAAEIVTPYPPGIPILYYGETITRFTVEYLIRLVELGASFQGVADKSLSKIKVYV